jgi:tetratricopeptide (TPR) repeat protein
MLEAQTFPDPAVQKLLSEFIPVKVDADKQGDLVERYSDGSLPTLAVIDANGRLLDSNTGFLDAANLQEWVGTARKAGEEMAALEARIADNPNDAAGALDLANRYVRVHEGAKALALLKGMSVEAVSKLSDDDQAQFLYTRAMAEFDAETYEDAVKSLKEFASRFPNDPRAAETPQYVMQGLYLAARAAFRMDDLAKARALYLEIGKDTSFPGAAETAKMELDRLDHFGKSAPALDVQEWIVGEAVDLAALKGKVVLLDFFQIADPGTDISRPIVEALRDKHKDAGLTVASIAIAFDMLDEQRPDAIGAYVADKNYTHPVALDKELTKTFLAYSGLGSPWTCIIDKEGKVAYLDFFDEERVPAKVAALLAK